ncbi:unnamed protein product [Rhodiola kirilowii]
MSCNSTCDTCPTNPAMDILNYAFPFRDMYQMSDVIEDSMGGSKSFFQVTTSFLVLIERLEES